MIAAMLRQLAVALAILPGCEQLEADVVRAKCANGMIEVPAGTFKMGFANGELDESPVHSVTLSAFCIDRTEVTVSQYRECVSAGRCTPASSSVYWPEMDDVERDYWSPFCHGIRTDRNEYPINCIDWDQARTFCNWAGKRLPTEAEWEYAARGTDGRLFPWGNAPPTHELENGCGIESVFPQVPVRDWTRTYDGNDGFERTAPVGRFPRGASPFGALDMAGNAWEWVADWYAPYPSRAVTNPRGPASGEFRVYRGGGYSCDGPATHTQSTNRPKMDPSFRSSSGTVRCVR